MKLFFNGLFMSGLLIAGAIFTGCDSIQTFPPTPPTNVTNVMAVAPFQIGDTVVVTLTTGTDQDTSTGIPPYSDSIKEDGTITLPLIGKVTAVGKTPGELQNEIHDLYVPKYYVRLTVTVKSPADERVYYVGGQVSKAGVQPYLGLTTVSKAIQAAGDFNDFASHTVTLTRASGERITVNVDDVRAGKAMDPPVYPGDTINVPHSLF
jgi:protein involved in polysaccharide export with SLBB domain